MTPAEIERAKHVDSAERRHRCVLLDASRIRCLDCEQTVVIPPPPAPAPAPVAASTSSTSHKHPLPINSQEACTEHPGQRAANCGGCRADRLVADAWNGKTDRTGRVLPDTYRDMQIDHEIEERMKLR